MTMSSKKLSGLENDINLNLKKEADKNRIIIGELSAPLSTVDRSCRQKISKGTLDLSLMHLGKKI